MAGSGLFYLKHVAFIFLTRPKIIRLHNETPIFKIQHFFKLKFRLLRLCSIIVFVFYFQKLIFGNIKKKQFSCIFEIKNMFG